MYFYIILFTYSSMFWMVYFLTYLFPFCCIKTQDKNYKPHLEKLKYRKMNKQLEKLKMIIVILF